MASSFLRGLFATLPLPDGLWLLPAPVESAVSELLEPELAPLLESVLEPPAFPARLGESGGENESLPPLAELIPVPLVAMSCTSRLTVAGDLKQFHPKPHN